MSLTPPPSAVPPPAARPALSPWTAVVLLCFAGLLNYADRAVFSAMLAPLQGDLGLSTGQLGLLGSLFLWSYALACPVAGFIADRFSRRSLVVISLGVWSLATALTGVINGFLVLAFMRVALGVSQSFYLPAGLALIGDYHGSATRGRAFAVHSVCLNAGIILGSTAAGYLAEGIGWRYSFWIFGGLGLVFAVVLQRSFPPDQASATPTVRPRFQEALGYLARTPSFYVIFSKTVLSGFTIWIFLNWLPLYFKEVHQFNLGGAGFVGTAILQGAFMVGLAGGGWFSDRISAPDPRRRLLMLSLCYLGAAPFLLLFLGNPPLLAIGIAIACFSFLRGAGDSCEKPALCEVVPARYRASAVGLMNFAATANGGIGVFLVGLFKERLGLEAIFAWLSPFLALAGVITFAGYRLFLDRDIARARVFEANPASAP